MTTKKLVIINKQQSDGVYSAGRRSLILHTSSSSQRSFNCLMSTDISLNVELKHKVCDMGQNAT